MGKYIALDKLAETMLGPRPKVAAMLDAGVPRCWIMILFLMAYMTNIDTWLAQKPGTKKNNSGNKTLNSALIACGNKTLNSALIANYKNIQPYDIIL